MNKDAKTIARSLLAVAGELYPPSDEDAQNLRETTSRVEKAVELSNEMLSSIADVRYSLPYSDLESKALANEINRDAIAMQDKLRDFLRRMRRKQ